jgi:hypothetical protein
MFLLLILLRSHTQAKQMENPFFKLFLGSVKLQTLQLKNGGKFASFSPKI